MSTTLSYNQDTIPIHQCTPSYNVFLVSLFYNTIEVIVFILLYIDFMDILICFLCYLDK